MREKELTTRLLALTNKVERIEKELTSEKNKVKLLADSVVKIQQPINKTTLHVTGGYESFNCAECGLPFILNEGQLARRFKRTNGKLPSFTCSAGHGNIFNS